MSIQQVTFSSTIVIEARIKVLAFQIYEWQVSMMMRMTEQPSFNLKYKLRN